MEEKEGKGKREKERNMCSTEKCIIESKIELNAFTHVKVSVHSKCNNFHANVTILRHGNKFLCEFIILRTNYARTMYIIKCVY